MPRSWPRSPPARSFTDPGARKCYVAILALPVATVDARTRSDPSAPPSARRERLDRCRRRDRIGALVDRDGRADLALGHDFHLGGDGDDRAVVGVVPLSGDGHADGHGDERVAALLALAVDDRDVPLAHIVRVVEQRDTLVEAGDGLRRERLDLLRLADHDEVVATDVPDERLRAHDLGADLLERRGEQRDDVVAAQPAVAVVERLEVVEVDVTDRERSLATGARRDLLVDAVIAGQTGQRRHGAHLGVAAQCRPHPRNQLEGVERFDDVVVGTGGESDHLVHRQALRRQHDDGQARGERIGAQPPGQLDPVDARHHHVDQREVRQLPADDFQGLLPVMCDDDVEALEPEIYLDEPGDVDVVVDDEDRAHAGGSECHEAAAVACSALARRRRTASAGSSAPYTAEPATNTSAPASAQRAIVVSSTPPSTCTQTECSPSRTSARARAIFGSTTSRNRCPPKPGSTVISRTMSISGRRSASGSTGVAGLRATPARAPPARNVRARRTGACAASRWNVTLRAPASA